MGHKEARGMEHLLCLVREKTVMVLDPGNDPLTYDELVFLVGAAVRLLEEGLEEDNPGAWETVEADFSDLLSVCYKDYEAAGFLFGEKEVKLVFRERGATEEDPCFLLVPDKCSRLVLKEFMIGDVKSLDSDSDSDVRVMEWGRSGRASSVLEMIKETFFVNLLGIFSHDGLEGMDFNEGISWLLPEELPDWWGANERHVFYFLAEALCLGLAEAYEGFFTSLWVDLVCREKLVEEGLVNELFYENDGPVSFSLN